jgi:hypothetical protein
MYIYLTGVGMDLGQGSPTRPRVGPPQFRHTWACGGLKLIKKNCIFFAH